MMKKIGYSLLIVVAMSFLSACNKTDESTIPVDSSNLLLGIWVNSQYVDTAIVMTRSLNFMDSSDGYEFKTDGTLIQRANAGWCGTPPISYANYTGTWSQMPDKTIFIETEYWDGSTSFSLEIIQVNESQLIYRQIFWPN
jgi:hypothetical protein